MEKVYQNLFRSIGAAIAEYRSRHNGEKPAYIVASMLAYNAIIAENTVRIRRQETPFGIDMPVAELFGIPIASTADPGYHIHLAETEIQLYAFPKED